MLDSREEIDCDEYGRIKVQFFWDRELLDREGLAEDTTLCWLRVTQSWAGVGAIAIPGIGIGIGIGMEVLVTFLEGNPDQPSVTGCLYPAEHVVLK